MEPHHRSQIGKRPLLLALAAHDFEQQICDNRTPDLDFDGIGIVSQEVAQGIVLLQALEEEFDMEIPDEEAEKITTVGQAITYIEANMSE